MKRNYTTPKADKVEFDYKETVMASNGWCCYSQTGTTGSESNNTTQDSSYWGNTGSSYWDNPGSSYWNDPGSSYWGN